MGVKISELVRQTIYKPVGNAPSSLDYRQNGYVTEVKDQGSCGSCYIFSAIGAIEGQHAKQNGQLISLSEQQALDCGQSGCLGGLPVKVMQELASQGGSEREGDYSYNGEKGSCNFDSSRVVVKVSGGEDIYPGSEEGLKDALANYGPLSILLAVCQGFQGYTGGVFTENCPGTVNHALLLVGYGNEGGQEYWIIKNSWATVWGEQGYMRLAIGSGLCSIGQFTTRAMVK